MDSTIALRLGIAIVVCLAGFGAWRLINRIIIRRSRSQATPPAEFQAGKPAILYFTAPDCIPCRTIQKPELAKLREGLGNQIQVIEVDASAEHDLAAAWGVVSVPTTFILDAAGLARHVNHGVTHARVLERQVHHAQASGA